MSEPGLQRCDWSIYSGAGAAEYQRYHDEEWGRPVRDGRALWEKLILDGMQAGLAWSTILFKRDAIYAAFEGLDPERVAEFGEADVERLLGDPGIIRSRGKINAAITNALAYLEIDDFSNLIWSFTDGVQIVNAWESIEQVPTESEGSRAMAKALKARGFKFVGPTICYAFMQAVGIVNDHETRCFCYEACIER